MTTASLQLKLQRSRFAQHAVSAVLQTLPHRLQRLVAAPTVRRATPPSERAALEAQEVRELASAYARSDPGFASDLYAAAARHEGLQSD